MSSTLNRRTFLAALMMLAAPLMLLAQRRRPRRTFNFGVDDRGDALFLDVDGRVQLNFAELTFENGDVQVVDYNEHAQAKGLYRLYDFPGVRHVKTVRLVARAQSDEATLRLLLER
jgi:hypothetical protein